MSDGGITVSKVTTGVHYLEDIKVNVPHQVPVYIPANKALSSTDLHRALNSRIIFQLISTLPMQSVVSADPERLGDMERENQLLREALEKSSAQGEALQRSLEGVEAKLNSLVATVGKLATTPVHVVAGGGGMPVAAVSEAVGGEVPMFLPTEIVPKDATVQMGSKQEVSEGDSVSAAAAKLRQIRRGG